MHGLKTHATSDGFFFVIFPPLRAFATKQFHRGV
jgi:hypothetical protein